MTTSPASFTAASVALFLLAACKPSSEGTPATASAGASATARATASAATTSKSKKPPTSDKLGAACKSPLDCPRPDFDATCSSECKKEPMAAEGYCQVSDVTPFAGDGPCYGNKRGTLKEGTYLQEKTPFYFYCDVDADVYCDKDAHKCASTKAAGAACAEDAECGRDGFCDGAKKTCAAATAVGASCKDVRCGGDAYCDDQKVCVARKADEEPCAESNQCKSLTCVGGNGPTVCKAAKAPVECKL